MHPDDYPPQEPFTDIGARYHAEVMRRGAGVTGVEIALGDDPYRALAVYPAEAPTGATLCLMHGGGWTNGYKEWMAFMAPPLTACGVTVVSIGYRLAPRRRFPTGWEDCLDAIAWVHAHIADHGGDPTRLFLGGHSAGGHLAALAALRTDWLAPRGLPSDLVRGALPISGTYWFGPDSGLSMRPRFLGPEDAETDRAASPLHHVRSGAPPFLIACGERDFPHLRAQAARFADALEAASVPVERLDLAGCDHLGASYAAGAADGPWLAAARALMQPG
ncbi:MAG: alpha/beta hydrolase [Alphaproteobacteria bacterium]|nr:alpha/beta hydrolase [Alphaproteobacteria bacterium]